MNKSRFIEQLNLYLDNELSDLEVEEFLVDLRSDPEKRRIYGEYCRIHKACACLRIRDRGAYSVRKSWLQRISAVGGIAAAFGLVTLGGMRMYSTLPPEEITGSEIVSSEEVLFNVDPASRLASLGAQESTDRILNLSRWDSDTEDWRQGLILSRNRETDAFSQQTDFLSTEIQGSFSSWDTLLRSRSQAGEGRFGVIRASANSSSIYNPVYLRADNAFELSR